LSYRGMLSDRRSATPDCIKNGGSEPNPQRVARAVSCGGRPTEARTSWRTFSTSALSSESSARTPRPRTT